LARVPNTSVALTANLYPSLFYLNYLPGPWFLTLRDRRFQVTLEIQNKKSNWQRTKKYIAELLLFMKDVATYCLWCTGESKTLLFLFCKPSSYSSKHWGWQHTRYYLVNFSYDNDPMWQMPWRFQFINEETKVLRGELFAQGHTASHGGSETETEYK
jgi:hypothetical protein